MAGPLPQQRLLLELLAMSGEIAVPGPPDESLLWRTIGECRRAAWIRVTAINPELQKVTLNVLGRRIVEQSGATSA